LTNLIHAGRQITSTQAELIIDLLQEDVSNIQATFLPVTCQQQTKERHRSKKSWTGAENGQKVRTSLNVEGLACTGTLGIKEIYKSRGAQIQRPPLLSSHIATKLLSNIPKSAHPKIRVGISTQIVEKE
jgi:hypothetical protein